MASTVNTANLPVLLPRPHPHQPIRAIDSETFADLHLAHLTTDVPDSVLFPFLHGLEGENYQQNSFFAASSGLNLGGNGTGTRGEYASGGGRASNVVKVPRYRGLVWVACDEEGQQRQLAQGQPIRFSHPEDIDLDDANDDFDFGYDSQQSTSHQTRFHDNCGDAMQVDDDAPAPQQHAQSPSYDAAHISEDTVDASEDANAAPHMHPLNLRKPNASPPISINTGPHPSHTSFSSNPHGVRSTSAPTSLQTMANANPQDHQRNPDSRRLSTASSDSASSSSSSSSSTSASGSQYNFDIGTSGSYSTAASSVEDKDALFERENGNGSPSTPCTSPLTDICIDDCIPCATVETGHNVTGEHRSSLAVAAFD